MVLSPTACPRLAAERRQRQCRALFGGPFHRRSPCFPHNKCRRKAVLCGGITIGHPCSALPIGNVGSIRRLLPGNSEQPAQQAAKQLRTPDNYNAHRLRPPSSFCTGEAAEDQGGAEQHHQDLRRQHRAGQQTDAEKSKAHRCARIPPPMPASPCHQNPSRRFFRVYSRLCGRKAIGVNLLRDKPAACHP